MKKCMKYLKIVSLVLLLMFTLSGCVSLQDLRENHAVWKDSTEKSNSMAWKRVCFSYGY